MSILLGYYSETDVSLWERGGWAFCVEALLDDPTGLHGNTHSYSLTHSFNERGRTEILLCAGHLC